MQTLPFTTILGTDLSIVRRIPTDDGQDPQHWPTVHTPENVHCNVDRATLRQILLTGLDGICRFGKRMTHYENHGEYVKIFFEDGSFDSGDVLIGADGIRSVVRRQRAPHAQTADAGIRAIYGRARIENVMRIVPKEALEDIFCFAADAHKIFLGLGAVKFPTPPDEASRKIYPGAQLKHQDDYVVCIVGGRRERFPTIDQAMHERSSSDLQRVAMTMLKEWPSAAIAVVAEADPSSFFSVEMYTSIPCELDVPMNVTVLGDAIHAMTPTLGRGANLAMRDAALLSRQLILAGRNEQTISEGLIAYETDMLRYSSRVVRESVQIGEQRMAQNPLPH